MSTSMSTPQELFVHELGDILFAEQTIAKMLPKLAKEATDNELVAGFERHLKETEEQIENLKQVFELVGEPVKAEKCPAILGLKEEHDSFVSDESPSPEILDMFDAGTAVRVEHYEIAAYTALIVTAEALGHDKCVTLLQANLKQEQQMLKSAEKIAERLAKQPVSA